MILIISLSIIFHPCLMLFIVDGSSSMLKNWGKEDKWTIAEKSLLLIADSLLKEHENLHFGLRVYGHQFLSIDNNCEDTELKLPIGKNTLASLKDRLISVKPKGITPLAFTLEQTETDFEGLEGQKNILILITDGSESCLGNPCKILEILLANEVIVKPVIIGLDIDIESLKDYNCIKDVFNPHSVAEFEKNVLMVVKQAINFTTLQVNLIDENKKAIQTNVPMIFYSNSSNPSYTFYHKLDKNNVSDTLLIEPTSTYKLVVQTIPPLVKENIKLSASRHNIIELNAPLCLLNIKTYVGKEESNVIPQIPYFIKPSGSDSYIYSSETNHPQKYLFGQYDIDILTLPVTQLKSISFDSKEKELKISAPGKLILNAKFPIHGAIFTEINNELVNIYSFKPNTSQEILDLQPGNYSIVYRFNHLRKMTETVIKYIQIKPKEIIEIKI